MSPAIDFLKLFEHSPNSYMLLDRQLRFVAANRSYLRDTASRIEDLIGRDVFEVFPHDPADPGNDSVSLARQSFERVLATAAPDVLALIRYRVPILKDGRPQLEERFWSATHTPLLDDDGSVAYILQHTVDVTDLERRRNLASGAAPRSEMRSQLEAGVLERAREVQENNQSLTIERGNLRRLFEQAPGFMCFVRGPEHIFEIANAAYYQLVGHRDILGKAVVEALPELGNQGYLDLLARVFTTGEPFTGRGMRALLQREPGAALSEVFLDFSFQPILDAGGSTDGILVHGYDITPQKIQEAERAALLDRERAARGEAEAAESRQRFLAESIPQQVWTAGPNGDLDFLNRRVLDYFGASEAEMLGTGWQHAVHPEDISGCVERWRHSLRTGDEYECQFRLRRADGAYRWHLARALALRGADGRIQKWFGTNTDMDELTRARDELRRRSEFDQQLIGIVSHDLRNPLNAIGVATALLLKRGQLDDQQSRIVSRIMSSAERAARLIRDFLDFTQARVAGRIPVTRRPAHLRDIARQVFDEVLLTRPGRKGLIEHDGEDSGLWDPDRIAQLMGNLLSNAFQHSPESSAVQLWTRGDQESVTIQVHNQGAPIPPRDVPRLFEPFERGRDVSEAGRSVGLGLYISKQIVAAHQGTIDVHSVAGQGTTFTVRLPRGTVPPARAAEQDPAVAEADLGLKTP